MLNAICSTIPEWKNAQADVAEIRSDIVCMFRNIESILGDLLTLYNKGQFNGVSSVCVLVSAQRIESIVFLTAICV